MTASTDSSIISEFNDCIKSPIFISNSFAVNGTAFTLLIPMVSTKNFARINFDNWPVFSSGIITFLKFLRISPVLSGNGFRWTKWVLATFTPFLLSLFTACVMAP